MSRMTPSLRNWSLSWGVAATAVSLQAASPGGQLRHPHSTVISEWSHFLHMAGSPHNKYGTRGSCKTPCNRIVEVPACHFCYILLSGMSLKPILTQGGQQGIRHRQGGEELTAAILELPRTGRVENRGPESQILVHISARYLSSSVMSGKLLNLSEPQFPYL